MQPTFSLMWSGYVVGLSATIVLEECDFCDECTWTSVTKGFSAQLTPTPINSHLWLITKIISVTCSIPHSIPFHSTFRIFLRGKIFAKGRYVVLGINFTTLILSSIQVQVTGVVSGTCTCVCLASYFSISPGSRCSSKAELSTYGCRHGHWSSSSFKYGPLS